MTHDLEIAVLAGVVAALLSYTFGRLILRPRLHCSTKIRIRDDSQGHRLYQFKIYNASPARPIYDVRIAAVLSVPVTDPQAPPGRERNLLRVRMELSATEALRLNYFQTRIVAVERAAPTEFTMKRLQQLSGDERIAEHFYDLERLLHLNFYSEEDQRSHPDQCAKLIVTCNCKDSWTGRDFSFVFHPFTTESCSRGNFEGIDDNEIYAIEQRTVTRLVRAIRQRLMRHQEVGFLADNVGGEDQRGEHERPS